MDAASFQGRLRTSLDTLQGTGSLKLEKKGKDWKLNLQGHNLEVANPGDIKVKKTGDVGNAAMKVVVKERFFQPAGDDETKTRFKVTIFAAGRRITIKTDQAHLEEMINRLQAAAKPLTEQAKAANAISNKPGADASPVLKSVLNIAGKALNHPKGDWKKELNTLCKQYDLPFNSVLKQVEWLNQEQTKVRSLSTSQDPGSARALQDAVEARNMFRDQLAAIINRG